MTAPTYDNVVKAARMTATRDASSSTTGEAAASTGTTATKARIKNSGGTARISGLSVGTTGSAINLDNTSIASGQTVTISSATFTHAVDPV